MSAASRTAPDGQEWKQVYQRYRDTMYRVAVAALRAARRGDVDAQDIMEEAFTSVMIKPPREVTNWEALLVTVTKRKVADYLKSAEHTTSRLAWSTEDGQPEAIEPLTEDPAEIAVRRAHAQAIRNLLTERITQLPPQQQRVLTLRICESKTTGEIAETLGTTSANVSQLLRKGLPKIVDILAELDGVDEDVLAKLRPTRRAGGAA